MRKDSCAMWFFWPLKRGLSPIGPPYQGRGLRNSWKSSGTRSGPGWPILVRDSPVWYRGSRGEKHQSGKGLPTLLRPGAPRGGHLPRILRGSTAERNWGGRARGSFDPPGDCRIQRYQQWLFPVLAGRGREGSKEAGPDGIAIHSAIRYYIKCGFSMGAVRREWHSRGQVVPASPTR